MEYEAPTVRNLGSVAELTEWNFLDWCAPKGSAPVVWDGEWED
jgi:hypothetical protein